MSFLESPRGPQKPLSTGRFARNLAVACMSAGLALAALHSLGPVPTPITLDAERVSKERERCEVLFVGPSYVVAQIHPRVFDRKARKLGHKVRSCIFGGTGLRATELRVHLENLLDQPWPRLSLVVIDVTLGDEPRFDPENWFHPRSVQWHTWQSAVWIYEYYREHAWHVGGEQVTGELVINHLKHLGANYLNVGVGVHKVSLLGILSRMQRLAGRDVPLPTSQEEQYYADDLATRDEKKREQSRVYVEQTTDAVHAGRVARLVRKKQRRMRDVEREGAWLEELRTMVRQHGSEAYFLQAPVWKALPGRIAQVSKNDPLVFLDFDDPKAYPQLYEPRNRGRSNHVSWYGGVVYSKLLAIEILRAWKPRR